VPDLRAILRRFRPLVVPPGLPAAATIPADPEAELRSELAPIIRLIDEVELAAADVERHASQEAERLLAEADAAARALVDNATSSAPGARADAYASRRRSRVAAVRTEQRRARRDVARIHRTADATRPDLVRRVVDCVLETTAPPSPGAMT